MQSMVVVVSGIAMYCRQIGSKKRGNELLIKIKQLEML